MTIIARTTEGPRAADSLRRVLSRTIPNLPAQVVSLDQALPLDLTVDQRTTLLESARRLAETLGPMADTLAVRASEAERVSAWSRRTVLEEVNAIGTRIHRELLEEAGRIRRILRDEQWHRLPASIREPGRQFIPPPRVR